MNILFFTRNRVTPYIGGTEHVTLILCRVLQSIYGYKCFSAYIHYQENVTSEFEGEVKLSRINLADRLVKYVKATNISLVICQGEFRIAASIKKKLHDSNCKVIAVHHFAPGWEEEFVTFSTIARGLASTLNEEKLALKRITLYPYLKYLALTNRSSYKKAYKLLDRIVLLSETFISEFSEYAGLDDCFKLVSIPNPVSYNQFISEDEIKNKKKVCLIVGRLEEGQKNISKAIDIWKSVKQSDLFKEWKLYIAGDGPDKESYISKVNSENISDITFLGRIEPIEYYKEASIFLMTSKFEGRPLTLTEAQQFGCVPIVFNTFSSLSEMISDGADGFSIKEKDTARYINKMKLLMRDDELREEMARNAVISAKKFSYDMIAAKWDGLIKTIIPQ